MKTDCGKENWFFSYGNFMLTVLCASMMFLGLTACKQSQTETGNKETEHWVPWQQMEQEKRSPVDSPLVTEKDRKVEEKSGNYKGVPWGVEFENFKEIKHCSGNPQWKGKYFLDQQHVDDADLIALCLGAGITSFMGLRGVDFSDIPEEFYSIYLDDVYYIFYKNKFAMAFTDISSYDDVYKSLSENAAEGNTWFVEYGYAKNVKMPPVKVTVTCFKRQNNENVYLIKRTTTDVLTSVRGFLLIIPQSYYSSISHDIYESRNRKERNEKEMIEKQHQDDLRKLN